MPPADLHAAGLPGNLFEAVQDMPDGVRPSHVQLSDGAAPWVLDSKLHCPRLGQRGAGERVAQQRMLGAERCKARARFLTPAPHCSSAGIPKVMKAIALQYNLDPI